MRIEFQSMMKRETFIALYNRPARVCFRYDGKRLCTTPATIENGTSQIDVVFVPPIHLRFDLSNISALTYSSIIMQHALSRFHISLIIHIHVQFNFFDNLETRIYAC